VIAQVDGHYAVRSGGSQVLNRAGHRQGEETGHGLCLRQRLRHLGRWGAWVEIGRKGGVRAILYTSTGGQAITTAPSALQAKAGNQPHRHGFPQRS